jgi:hypothetical protein
MNLWRKILPVLISAGLVAWLVWKVSPHRLLAAAEDCAWQPLAWATVALVLALYFWDAVCVRTVFAAEHGPRLSYGRALYLRGTSYLAGAINYEAGQALVAWSIARFQNEPFRSTISRSVMLAYLDMVLLVVMGLTGAVLSGDPQTHNARLFCLVALPLLLSVAVVIRFLPSRQRERFKKSRWGIWMNSWSWGRTVRLVAQRIVYYGILVVYGAGALHICQISLAPMQALNVIALATLVNSLPSAAGLGTRAAALILLLGPQYEARIVALDIFWSAGLIAGRLAIGLALFWLGRMEAINRWAGDEAVASAPVRQP